MKLTERWDG